jgi:hypothetical protein
MGIMLASTSLQGVRALKGVGAGNLQFPAVTSLRANDQDTPVPGAIGEDMFDKRNYVPLYLWIAGVVRLHDDCHISESTPSGDGERWRSQS